MAELEQGFEELKVVKKAFKDNFDNEDVSTNNVEFRNMPNLLKQMEKKLPTQTKEVAPSTSPQTITPDSGYKLSQVNIKAVIPSDYYKPEQVLSVSPKITSQTITPSANYVYNKVNINAVTSTIDSNIIPTNIRKGTSILGVQGNLEADKPDQSKVINPTTSTQIVVGDTGYELAKVTVNAVTNAIDSNIKAENIKQGVSILGVDGTFEGTKQPNLQEKNIEPATIYQSIVPDNGYDGLSKVNISAVTNSIDSNIQPQNIKKGVTILGVNGAMQATSGSPKFSQLIDGTIESLEESDLSEPNKIKDYTFYGCKNLTSVIVPSNVKTIGANAFKYCSSLQSLTLAEGIQSIGANAFDGINASEIEIPNTVSVLESEVFSNNTALTSITIPSGITELKDNVFNGCTSLTEVTMNGLIPPVVDDTTFPNTVVAIKVPYGAYESYLEQWSAYTDKIVRLPAIPSTIMVVVDNYLGEKMSGASVTITGNDLTFTGTTDNQGVFTQGDLQPATYTIEVADLEGFKTPDVQEVIVTEGSSNVANVTYLEKPSIILFSEATPQEISTISAEISANNMTSTQVSETYGWKIGDTTDITLTTGEVIQMRIIGFNQTTKSDSDSTAGITLETTNCVDGVYRMYSSGTNIGGYDDSEICLTNLKTLENNFPQEWRDIICPVQMLVAYNNSSVSIKKDMTLFLLSSREIFESDTTSIPVDGVTQYEYYKINNTDEARIKTNKNGEAQLWWTRSPISTNANWRIVYKDGTSYFSTTNQPRGLSFAFCV